MRQLGLDHIRLTAWNGRRRLKPECARSAICKGCFPDGFGPPRRGILPRSTSPSFAGWVHLSPPWMVERGLKAVAMSDFTDVFARKKPEFVYVRFSATKRPKERLAGDGRAEA